LTLYFDTSALLPYYRAEPASERIEALLRSQERPVWVSQLTWVETASALARWVRTGELTEFQAKRVEAAFHEDLGAGRLRTRQLERAQYERAYHWLLGRATALRTLDALHLACAEALGATLVTLDGALHDAAAFLGIEVHAPDRL